MTTTRPILQMNRFDPTKGINNADGLAVRVARRTATAGASSVLFYEQPVEMVRGQGVHLLDVAGRRYLDAYNNVASVGHCHPRVVQAIADQVARLNINTRYLNNVVDTYAERLLATFPRELSNLVMTCTGSEANDLALRIAWAQTGDRGIVVTRAAYHGNTAAVTDISPSSLMKQALAPHVRAIPEPEGTKDTAFRFCRNLDAAVVSLRQAGFGFAGLVVDTIFSSDGIHADPAGFLHPVMQAVHRHGGLFIADEVQPGFGRTGAGLWGFSRHGIVPDIVTLGKPMGNGFPMGGVVTRPELLARFCQETGYFNTFGGNPVAAAAGLAVLDVLRDEALIENAAAVGVYLKERLGAMSDEQIGAVRGAGLFIGVDLIDNDGGPDPDLAASVVNEMKKRGVLIGVAGYYGSTLKIRPPLCLARTEADLLADCLWSILQMPR